MLSNKAVAIASAQEQRSYPTELPFVPDEPYPELKGRITVGKEKNITYKLLRGLMYDLGMDILSYSTHDWNPFGEIISPGQKILIKPNLVRHLHFARGDYNAVVTHGSLVRGVLDYVALALKGQGEITVGDAPVQGADFDKILERTGLKEVCDDVSESWGIPVRLVDFRLWSVELNDSHRIIKGSVLKGDPHGYVTVDLGKKSLLMSLDHLSEKFRVTNYNCQQMRLHHNSQKHEYLIPQTVLDADVVINLPKLKTHRKVGLSAALKNIVGINGHKDWLPHHRCGSIIEGGDEYKNLSHLKRYRTKLEEKIDKAPYHNRNSLNRIAIRATDRLIQLMASDQYTEGSWYGNDTLWRTVLDLNRLLIYADKEGRITEIPQRTCFTMVDAIVAGEGEGPMEPDPRHLGLLVGGINPVAVDSVLATMIGFDYRKISIIIKAFELGDWSLIDFSPENIEIYSSDDRLKSFKIGEPFGEFIFKPPSGWTGHIESIRNASQ